MSQFLVDIYRKETFTGLWLNYVLYHNCIRLIQSKPWLLEHIISVVLGRPLMSKLIDLTPTLLTTVIHCIFFNLLSTFLYMISSQIKEYPQKQINKVDMSRCLSKDTLAIRLKMNCNHYATGALQIVSYFTFKVTERPWGLEVFLSKKVLPAAP